MDFTVQLAYKNVMIIIVKKMMEERKQQQNRKAHSKQINYK